MDFQPQLIKATIHKRYKRFLADITLASGEQVVAHCPNTGSMKSCFEPEGTIYISQSLDHQRKLPYTWQLSEMDKGYVGINTHLTNALVLEALQARKIPLFQAYSKIQREVYVPPDITTKSQKRSRLDFLLSGDQKPIYCEVKNATLFDAECDAVMFPDAPTERGRAHLHALTEMSLRGIKTSLLFVVNRPHGRFFRPADPIDAEYGRLLREAKKAGVVILAWRTMAKPPYSLTLHEELEVVL